MPFMADAIRKRRRRPSSTMPDLPDVETRDQPPSVSVAVAIAHTEGVPVDELHPPLYEKIDLDALDDLFAPTACGTPRTAGLVKFHYQEYKITVTSNGKVTVELKSP